MTGRLPRRLVRFSPDARSACGLGCVKTPKFNLPIEISSRLHQSKEQMRWRSLSGVDDRENNSAPFSRAHVFTQPRPIATRRLRMAERRFRRKAEMVLSSLPCAASRRRGRSMRQTTPASSFATTTGRRLGISMSRRNPVGARRPSCAQGTRRGGWRSTLPSCFELVPPRSRPDAA